MELMLGVKAASVPFYLLFLVIHLGPHACRVKSPSSCGKTEIFLLSTKGHRLQGASFEKLVASAVECAHLCLSEGCRCQSINFGNDGRENYRKRSKCQLNNETRTTKPGHLVVDEEFEYYDLGELRNDVLCPPPTCAEVSQSSEPFHARSCADWYKKGERSDGIYSIDPDGLGAFPARCDMSTAGGGWTVFQRRVDGSVDFYLGWSDYKNGFGDLNGEFWLGLDRIHRLSSRAHQNVLRVDMEDFHGEQRYAQYLGFQVSSEEQDYTLTVGSYSGNAKDSLTFHSGMKFSTKDADHDSVKHRNCATQFKGAWWYHDCHASNLNGVYKSSFYGQGINWFHWTGHYHSLKKTEMKMRPKGF